jgi:methionine-rich copper-binding protein CopC
MTARRIILAITLLLATMTSASAHSFPVSEMPTAGAALAAAPPQVTITFDAPIEQLFAQLRVLDAGGRDLAIAPPEVGTGSLTLAVNLPVLRPGHYKVEWAVVCIDTHHTNGSYEFIVTGARS